MNDIVQSVDRALSILEVLADHSEDLGVTEISDKVGLHKSTVYRLLGTLIYKGYVIQSHETNKYRLTLKLFELGNKRTKDMDILTVSKPYTKELMEKVNEVIHLVIREGNNTIYIDKVEADNTIRMPSTIGTRSPLYSTSVGKAILAYLPDKEVETIWNTSNIEKRTEHTITSLEEMKDELQKVRQKGYAIDDEENEIGVRCVGAPVFNRFGNIEGAISISGPTIRVTKDIVEEFAKDVVKYASLISKELGYRE